jgi:hypothetical protein
MIFSPMFNESIKFSMIQIWLFFRQGQGVGPNLSLQIRQSQPGRFVGASHNPNPGSTLSATTI